MDADGLLEPALNETFLYHGTSPEIVEIVTRHGFDERMAALSGLYGAGVYFANQSCKAGQYAEPDRTGVKTIIISRVTLGDPFYASGHMNAVRRPPDRHSRFWGEGTTYDSVVANASSSQAHRELIVYDHRSAYPEYVVWYKEG